MNKSILQSDPVIIFVSLLGAFILVIGLNWLVKCFLGCRGQITLDLSDQMVIQMANSDLKALPIIVYSATSKPRPVATDCPICLAEFTEGEKLRVLPNCNHGFHLDCIDRWLVSNSSCPMCRHSLNFDNKKAGGAAMVEATESNNIIRIVIEPTYSTQATGVVSPHTETFHRTPDEAAVMTS